MFEHLNLEFDLTSKKVIAETAAKDYHGVPIYQYIYDSGDHQSTEIVNIPADEEASTTVVAPTQQTPSNVTPTEAAAATTAAATESVSEETAATEENVNENGDRVLTLEEQRDVAFKVIFFFMMLILASFAILYIYHRTSQKNRKDNSTQQKTL